MMIKRLTISWQLRPNCAIGPVCIWCRERDCELSFIPFGNFFSFWLANQRRSNRVNPLLPKAENTTKYTKKYAASRLCPAKTTMSYKQYGLPRVYVLYVCIRRTFVSVASAFIGGHMNELINKPSSQPAVSILPTTTTRTTWSQSSHTLIQFPRH